VNWKSIIVGLGNPGPEFLFTRHNVGFMAVDLLALDLNLEWQSQSKLARRCQSHIAEGSWAGESVLLVKPQTFMNRSGLSVQALYQEYSLLREAPLIVLHDEVDIEFGKLRVKHGGSDAGHNGLRSLRESLGHGDYFRIRIGVGRAPEGQELADHVLGRFPKSDQERLARVLSRALDVCDLVRDNKLHEAQSEASKEI
jgi:PTH1 family peptidyl-tRNA hydrolase